MLKRILFMATEAAMALPFLLPILLLLNKYRFHSLRRTLLYLLFSYYLAAMYAVAGLPNILHTTFVPRFNLYPLQYMFSDWENTLLNLLLFIPLGFFLPFCWEPLRKPVSTALLGFSISGLIEVLQLFTFRATDINDLITNTLGTLLGYVPSSFLTKHFCPVPPRKDLRELPLLLAAVYATMYLLQPAVSLLFRCG